MSSADKPKPPPELTSDADAERFVAEGDLSQYDLSGFQPTRFEFRPKNAQINMRLPEDLLDALKAQAQARGIPYQRHIREILEASVRTKWNRTG